MVSVLLEYILILFFCHLNNMIGFTCHLHTRHIKYFTKLEMRLWLNSLIYQLGIATLNYNYQNNCRNIFGWLVDLSYKVAGYSNYFTYYIIIIINFTKRKAYTCV